MSVYRVLRAQDGNILNRLRDFFSLLWSRIELEAMLAPLVLPGDEISSQVIENPSDLSALNPFAPLMQTNMASAVDELVRSHPKGLVGVILRPCELRTLIELQKRHPDRMASQASGGQNGTILTVGLDCPGTLAVQEFTRRLKTLGIDPMTREALACGAENRFFPGPLRRACQLCERPVPIGADLTIGIFGTSSEQSLFIIPKDETTDARLELAYSTDGFATQTEGSGRESAVKAILAASAARRDDLSGDEQGRPGNISSLLVSFARCSLCADCLDACPLYEGELSGMLSVGTLRQRERPVLAELIGISRWLASCSGCGMCEEVCEWDIPLTLLMARLSQYIHQELHYVAGEPGQNLPWAPVECRESWR